MNFDLQLAGRRALVTGGTKGVGAAVVQALSDAGMQVMATARSVPTHGVKGVRYVAADLSTPEGVAEVAQSVLRQWDGIDVLVNVFGGSSAPGGGFAALDDAQWSMELNQNLMPAVRLDRALLPAMLAQGSGVVVHVGSIQSVLPLPESTIAYAAAKAALSTCSQALSNEVRSGVIRSAACEWHAANTGNSPFGRNPQTGRIVKSRPGHEGILQEHPGQRQPRKTQTSLIPADD